MKIGSQARAQRAYTPGLTYGKICVVETHGSVIGIDPVTFEFAPAGPCVSTTMRIPAGASSCPEKERGTPVADRPKDFDYPRYLASREWSLLREQVRERSGNHCEHCFIAPQQAVHHLTYERIGREDLSDLMAVCNPCHEWLSGHSSVNPLYAFAAVSPPMAVSHVAWKRHLIVPFRVPEGYSSVAAQAVVCNENQCVFCAYLDDMWVVFIQGLVLPGDP